MCLRLVVILFVVIVIISRFILQDFFLDNTGKNFDKFCENQFGYKFFRFEDLFNEMIKILSSKMILCFTVLKN